MASNDPAEHRGEKEEEEAHAPAAAAVEEEEAHAPAAAAVEEEEAHAPAAAAAEEEDTGAQVAPIVRLEEVPVTTGEEEEGALLDLQAKLYRFDKDGNQWKERGTGTVKLLKHYQSSKVRLVMRQAKTLKICANHLVLSSIKLQEHAGSDKSCVWHATDFSDGELKDEMFCIRFGSVDNCKKFMETVEEIADFQGRKEEEESREATSAAGLLANLSVTESKVEEGEASGESEEKKQEEKPDAEKKSE